MVSPQLTRARAIKALRQLINVRAPLGSDKLYEIFHFGVLPSGLPQKAGEDWERAEEQPPEKHRSIVLVIGAILEQGLATAILVNLPGIEAGNEGYVFMDDAAPLRDFDARIRMAFALGIFGEGMRSDLSLIRSIRNTFAHSRLDINFDTPEVVEACRHFTLPKRTPTSLVSAEPALRCFIDVGCMYAARLITYKGAPQTKERRRFFDLPPLPEK